VLWANHLQVPFFHQGKPQVPPLRYTPVGMTNLTAASTHSASCAVQKAIRVDS
jgi:hypothetical protein